jgi:hypothetical protein
MYTTKSNINLVAQAATQRPRRWALIHVTCLLRVMPRPYHMWCALGSCSVLIRRQKLSKEAMRPRELDKNSYVSASVISMLALHKGKEVACKVVNSKLPLAAVTYCLTA